MVNDENSSLHFAASSGDVLTILAILNQGIDVSGVDNHGRTALHYAVWEGQLETVRVLIEHGANLNAKRLAGHLGNAWTPLHFAAENDETECARILLEAGAETDPEDEYGQTPLMIAVDEMKSPNVARLLILHGANGRRAWAWARDYSDGPGAKIMELLKSTGADSSKS